jgi:arylsulfatase A-like enzyme
VLELALVPVSDQIQGRSLVPLLAGAAPADWRKSILVEFYTYEKPMPWLMDMDYRMVRTARYKFVHWTHHPDLDELYDLQADPYEMANRMEDPALGQVRSELRRELGRLSLQAMGLEGN